LDTAALQLREELLALNLESVDLVKKGSPPKVSKVGGEVVSWGSLLVSLAVSRGALPGLIGTVQSSIHKKESFFVLRNVRFTQKLPTFAI
jgi:hypothetical protein